jgi:hypothetical protein
MLVHSFRQGHECFKDYKEFLALFNLSGKVNALSEPRGTKGIQLFSGWVTGDKKYLKK